MEEKKYNWTLKLSFLGIVFLVINFFIIGGGHGYYEPLYFLFPFPCLFLSFSDVFSPFLLSVFFLSQYPIYGLILDKNRTKLKSVGLVILTLHLVFAFIAYYYRPENFK
jgi:hypothetical protein